MIELYRGKPYPLPIHNAEGASANFLTTGGNILQICLPGMTRSEERVYRKNPVRAGVLIDLPLILLLFDYGGNDVLDCPFDARLIRNRQLPDIETRQQRLFVESHIIDTETGILRGLRGFTLAPKTTLDFLSAVQDQLAMPSDPAAFAERLHRIYRHDNRQLTRKTEMILCGKK